MFLQVSLDFFGPSVTRARTKASKIVRFLESLAAAPTGFGQLSVTPPGENHRAEFSLLLKELQATSQTVSCNVELLMEDYRRGCKGIVASCDLISVCLCTHSPSELSRGDIFNGDIFNSKQIINILNTLEITNRFTTHLCVVAPSRCAQPRNIDGPGCEGPCCRMDAVFHLFTSDCLQGSGQLDHAFRLL